MLGARVLDMAKTKPFTMRLNEDLKAKLQERATAENRSLTNYMEHILWQAVAPARSR